MKLVLLRLVLMIDAAVLFLLGGFLILAPTLVERAFHFQELPGAVSYLVGLWGCVLATLGCGYVVAATDPLRHVVWVQIGIARGVLEFFVGIAYLSRGVVTVQQVAFGLIVAALMALAYVMLYPRNTTLGTP